MHHQTAASACKLVFFALAVWAGIHLAFGHSFLVHDSWNHIFPISFRIMQQADGFRLPMWLGGVDSGSPLIIYSLSLSLFNPVRLITIAVGSWLRWDVASMMLLQKLSILATYLIFCAGMYVLGRVLFRHRLAAVYLFIASLFAGLCLETLHSDQTVSILFWLPWATASGVLFHRHREGVWGARYLCLAFLLICLGTMDQHPLLVSLPAAFALVGYVILWPRESVRFARSYGWRLWPALVVLTVVLLDLSMFQQAIVEYRPSFRSELKVDPREMGPGGFIQPLSFPGMVLPLGFLTAQEQMHYNTSILLGRPYFVSRFNSLVLNLGFVPVLLTIVFLLNLGKQKRGLLVTGIVVALLLVALQCSFLYFALSAMPVFDSFRSYFLLIHPIALGLLVMSGYGMDVLLSISPTLRRRLLVQALVFHSALVTAGMAAMACLLYPKASADLLCRTAVWSALDLGIVLGCTLALFRSLRVPEAVGQMHWVIVPLVVTQAIYFVGVHHLVGTHRNEVLIRYGIDRAQKARPPASLPVLLPIYGRQESESFAASYLSPSDTVSFRRDLEGTFLRSRSDALYQEGLEPAALKALSGLSRPVFWLSTSTKPYDRSQELVETLNDHKDDLAEHLARVVHVPRADLEKLEDDYGRAAGAGSPGIVGGVYLVRDGYAVSYHSEHPAILVGAVTFDPAWVARINSRLVPMARGNFNGLAIAVPSGEGTLELSYDSWRSRLYFGSRYSLLLVALGAGLVLLGKEFVRQRPESVPTPTTQRSRQSGLVSETGIGLQSEPHGKTLVYSLRESTPASPR